MRILGILVASSLCLVGAIAESELPVEQPAEPEKSEEPEAPAKRPGLVEFMAGYCEAILHVHVDEAGESAVDYWKVDDDMELAREETLSYLQARKLTDDVTPDLSKIFFLRLLTEEELGEMLHFATRIKDEEQREKFKSKQFKYALVKLITVQDGTFELAEGPVSPGPGGQARGPTTYSLDEFRDKVLGYLQAGSGETEPAVTDG